MKLDAGTKAELEAGVSQSRLAQLAELSPSTVRGYEKEGLIPTQSQGGKKRYDRDALTALETIKRLRAEGLDLAEIVTRMKPSSNPAASEPARPAADEPARPAATEAELRAQVERLRAQLQAERAKIEQLSNQVETRVVRRRNELVLTKKELEELERLRESNVKRAVAVTRRATAIRYAGTRPGVILFDPKKPRK